MRRCTKNVTVAMVLWLAPFRVQAQPVPVKEGDLASGAAKPSTLQGFVRDSAKHPLAGVIVSLKTIDEDKDDKQKQIIIVTTDLAGSYRFPEVRPGSYVLRAAMPGYGDAILNIIVLGEKQLKGIDLILDVAGQRPPNSSSPGPPDFFDEPHFAVAGVTDTTGLGGHGSDTVVRNREALATEAASLRKPSDELHADAIAGQHHRLADADEKQGKPLEAVREYQRAAELNPSEANIFDWGTELLLHRAAEPAVEVFTEGNRLFPHSVRMLTALGAALYSQGAYDQAVQRICQASDLNPNDLDPYLFMGKIEAAEATPSDAIAERLARFVGLYPESALAKYYYAVSLWKRRSSPNDAALAQIKSLLEKSIQLDPTLGLAYLQLGILYSEQKDFSNAVSAYRQAIHVTPQLEPAHYRLAQIYRQAGETTKAAAELQLYQQITREKAEATERQRHELQQFVYRLRDQPAAMPPK